jgi:hypothetical protein
MCLSTNAISIDAESTLAAGGSKTFTLAMFGVVGHQMPQHDERLQSRKLAGVGQGTVTHVAHAEFD